MKIKIDTGEWQQVLLFEPPSKTVILEDGSVWHLGQGRNEILALDVFLAGIIEKYAPWEIRDKKTLALSGCKKYFPNYKIEIEEGDELKYELFYLHKFSYGQSDYLKFPEYPGIPIRRCVWKLGLPP